MRVGQGVRPDYMYVFACKSLNVSQNDVNFVQYTNIMSEHLLDMFLSCPGQKKNNPPKISVYSNLPFLVITFESLTKH